MLRPVVFALMLGLALPVAGYADTPQISAPQISTLKTGTPKTSVISHEPYFADLVSRARHLETETKTFGDKPTLSLLTKPAFKTYTQQIRSLSDDDLQGHMTLKTRGTDNDLKCIMKGLSLDLNIKMDAILAAKTDAELGTALTHMADLLSDNVDVIVTPATADSGLDCVIEFGNT